MMLIEASAYRMLHATPIVVDRGTPLDDTLVVDVERPLSGQEYVYYHELRQAQMLV